jgi:hypothetical protein
LDVQQSTNNYLNVSTVNGAENMSFGNATTNPSFSFLGTGSMTAPQFKTLTNCAVGGASPAACGSSVIGRVTVAVGQTTVVVDTTAATANSVITTTFNSGATIPATVCDTTVAYPSITAQSAGHFTITIPAAPVGNPACITFAINNAP